jgi:hypothetical protein
MRSRIDASWRRTGREFGRDQDGGPGAELGGGNGAGLRVDRQQPVETEQLLEQGGGLQQRVLAAQRRGRPVGSTRAPRAHPEFRRLAANPGDEAPQLRMLAQPLDRVVLPLQFLLGQCCMDRGMADPVQGDSVPTIAAARYQMMLIDTAAALPACARTTDSRQARSSRVCPRAGVTRETGKCWPVPRGSPVPAGGAASSPSRMAPRRRPCRSGCRPVTVRRGGRRPERCRGRPGR